MENSFNSEDELVGSRSPVSRAHFPSHELYSNRNSRSRMEGKLPSGLTPPIRRGSPLNPQNANQVTDPRRRSRPSDVLPVSPDVPSRHRRATSFAHASLARPDSDSNTTHKAEPEGGAFSDEYDLSHEDPRILQDVQRALKMKARREARLKRETIVTPEKVSAQSSPSSAQYSTPTKKSLPSTFSVSPSFSPSTNRKLSGSTVSDVDFGPSTAVYDQENYMHPVPSSTDNGASLDWTGSSSEDSDKRWMGIGKKKEREKLPPLELMLGQQEHFYEAKLLRIRESFSAQTIRKAEITSDQLERRYNMIYDSLGNFGHVLNVAAISRWYRSRPEAIKGSLEKSEPFTWLKHLEKRSVKKRRSPWNLSALIMKEYIQSEGQQTHMQTIPEESTIADPNISLTRTRSPSFVSAARARALSTSLSLKMPADDQISFEPFAETNRSSLDVLSRRSVDSRPNSVHSGISAAGISPRSPVAGGSDEDAIKTAPAFQTSERPRSPGSSSSGSSDEGNLDKDVVPSLIVPGLSVQPPSNENTPLPDTDPFALAITSRESSTSQVKSAHSPANHSLSSLKTSLKHPPTRNPMPNNIRSRYKRTKVVDREISLQREYEMKSHLLHDTIAHNNRIRQFLNKISAAMKEFDSIQNVAMRSQGIHKLELPKDLLEAFGHDPSAVTGATRRDRGWRAVEDINQRVEKQRNVFRTFIQSFVDYQDNQDNYGCVLDDSIDNILEAFETLQLHRTAIQREAASVSGVLDSVENVHAGVKENYNSTLSHVSIVYPELSHIVALEESYKDQYQQVWELGMDALTLLLDTVTPFWRTYGKTIGEDVRDFLIVPLYRNEFTGEAKSYPINSIPKRSCGHWLGLVIFFHLSIVVNILQFRAAISSSLHFRLHLIPYDGIRWTALPFFWLAILIQWLAVIVEFSIVFLQLGIITWWSGWFVKFWA